MTGHTLTSAEIGAAVFACRQLARKHEKSLAKIPAGELHDKITGKAALFRSTISKLKALDPASPEGGNHD